MANAHVKASKFMSHVLRHAPERIGIDLDGQGWVLLDQLVEKSEGRLTHKLVLETIVLDEKQRYALSSDRLRVRANQGHSIEIDLGLAPIEPPETLYHGTADRFVDSIRAEGLVRRSRLQVHLSQDHDTAVKVGARHGNPVVLLVAAARMQADGLLFYQADNGVWLTDHVPSKYLTVPAS